MVGCLTIFCVFNYFVTQLNFILSLFIENLVQIRNDWGKNYRKVDGNFFNDFMQIFEVMKILEFEWLNLLYL